MLTKRLIAKVILVLGLVSAGTGLVTRDRFIRAGPAPGTVRTFY